MTEYKMSPFYGLRHIIEYPVKNHYANDFATVVRQLTKDQETVLQIRRIDREKTDGKNEMHELQIEITITKIGMKRNQSLSSSFVVPLEVANAIGMACLKTQDELKLVIAEKSK